MVPHSEGDLCTSMFMMFMMFMMSYLTIQIGCASELGFMRIWVLEVFFILNKAGMNRTNLMLSLLCYM